MLATQLKSGQKYDTLKKTVSIVIADFELVNNSSNYHHVFHMSEASTGIIFTDISEVHTLEIRKISAIHDGSQMYEWIQFLGTEQEEDFQMLAEKNPVIKKAVIELRRLSQDEENQFLYDMREKAERDEISRLSSAKRQGMAEGIAKGSTESKSEIARTMRSKGFDDDTIAEITKLSIAEIRNK